MTPALLTSEGGSFNIVTIAARGMPVTRVSACVVVRRVLVARAGLTNEAEDANGGDDRQPDHSMHVQGSSFGDLRGHR